MNRDIKKVSPLYALPAIPLALMVMSYYVYLPKYLVDYRGFPLLALAGIIVFSRVWDAILDPLIGRLSDRTKAGRTRRKSWITLSLVPLICSFLALYYWPSIHEPFVFLFFSLLFFVFLSAYLIPFEAWGITLARDYDERNIIMSWREGFVILGTFLSGLIPFLLQLSGSFDQASVMTFSAGIYCLLLAVFTLVTTVKVNEPATAPELSVNSYSWGQTLRHALRNSHFRVLIIAYVFSSIGAVVPATLILFYVEHYLQSSNANFFLSLYFLSGMVALPFWLKLAQTIEKRAVWLTALALNTVSFSLVYLLTPGQEVAYGVLVFVSGLGFGATMAIPPSMQADVIDYDEYLYHVRREGSFVGLWAVARKLSAALAAGLALQTLALAGYQPGEPPGQEAVATIRFVYTLVPSFFNFVAILFALRYVLDRELVARIKSEIAAR
jgi:GPH family glycoside/pentoside/hexuronide:cation symporter